MADQLPDNQVLGGFVIAKITKGHEIEGLYALTMDGFKIIHKELCADGHTLVVAVSSNRGVEAVITQHIGGEGPSDR